MKPFTRTHKIWIAAIIVPAIVTIVGFVKIPPPNISISNSPGSQAATVNGNGNAVAIGPNAQAVINKPAVYSWTNKSSWSSQSVNLNMEMAGGARSGFGTDLIFDADNGLLPVTACLAVAISRADILYIEPSLTGIYSTTESDGKACMTPSPRHIVLTLYTDAPPVDIQAKLIGQ